MNPNAPDHGRPGITNQDAALTGMREMQRQGISGAGVASPPISPQRMQSKLHWRSILGVVSGPSPLAAFAAALYDAQIGAPGTPAWIAFAVVLGTIALVELELFLKLLVTRPKLLREWHSSVTSNQVAQPAPRNTQPMVVVVEWAQVASAASKR